ncbi:MAG: Holliday junction branch migration DNA helicase RuvB [Candidatus Moranbacteria bacterium]|nr:Holliday junction branch migration DNA helicase RuvB [Candidatus Moranbacteria bacterium]
MLEPESQDNREEKFQISLRPKKLLDYIGQTRTKENLEIFIQACQKRNEPLEHVLIYGPAGLGKTTLSHIIANEMQANIKITSGPAIEKVGDLASILTNLEEGDVLFIDEVHRMNKLVEESLYPAMEDYKLDIIIGKGPSARVLQLDLPKFTLIGATTRIGLVSSPLRSRFGMTYKLDFYSDEEIAEIIKRSAGILNVSIKDQGCRFLAACSRKNPRVANRLLKRVRDIAQVKADGLIDQKMAKMSLEMLQIDEMGLEPADRYILETLINKFNGGPVGIGTLAASTSEEKDTIEEIYEPYLLKIGFIQRTSRGRMATKKAYEHLNLEWLDNPNPTLF